MNSLIPTHAVSHISDGLSEYLTTTISLSDSATAERLREFLLDPHDGMFHGPYVRSRLPYAPAEHWEGVLSWLPEWFEPYRHQAQAFERLASWGPGGAKRPEPTLVVTGTGSGKTESFLYPVLDHCRRNPGSGIKAVILYPMNALAADQERRLAELLTSNSELSGITAGLFTGEVVSGGLRMVSEQGLITDRDVMRDTPPDILLTNYKMLDQLLLREDNRALWEKSAQTLQYLVLDEFHTYDAAQGTDVAMLLRRLGLMLRRYQPEGFLSAEEQARPLGRVTPVATSATLGGGPTADGVQEMLKFAYTVFGEQLPEDAIVGETLLSVSQWQATLPELLGQPLPSDMGVPEVGEVRAIVEKLSELVDSGVEYQEAVHRIACAHIFHCAEDTESAIAAMATNEVVTRILTEASSPLPLEHTEAASGDRPATKSLVERVFPDAADRRNLGKDAAEFLTLVLSEMAYLRAQFGAQRGWDGKKIPGVETHLWVREISRVDRVVSSAVERGQAMFRWSDNGVTSNAQRYDDAAQRWLPAIYCRHCGRSGWMTAMQPGDDMVETAVQKIRQTSIADKARIRPLIDATSEEAAGMVRSRDGGSRVRWLDMELPAISDTAPDAEARETGAVVPVLMYAGENIEERAAEEYCPSCGEPDSIRYLGSSVATLLSVALSNLFGMEELGNEEKKTLVFADSVQDAAHRAGFIQSRARAFALRARINRAAEELIERSAEGCTHLDQLVGTMISHAQGEGSPEEQARALYELLPPELTHSTRFRGVWEKDTPTREKSKALRALEERLQLDLALQFGDRVDLPRSLVSTGTLTVAVDVSDDVLLTAAREVGVLADDKELLGWARGVVEKMRIEGGINHPWFKSYLTNDCNPYLLNRRQTRARGVPAFPRGGTPRFPRSGAALRGVQGKRNNNATMPLGSQRGWYARWTARALGVSAGSSFTAATLVSDLFTQLEIAGVVGSVPSKSGGRIYFLDPGSVVVRQQGAVELLECSVCRMRVGVDAASRAALDGQACYSLDCEGHFTLTTVEDNYYRQLYQSHNTRTVVAAEHTGLVPTLTRKQVEDQFKVPITRQEADSPNVLVATPTLEMGIDIGDLSTVMLSSMPRSVASYVQRVGRAGRLSGNSLIVALVRGRGRALTKLEHPLETIAGSVTAPAAYLSARDIMRRQFVAYLFDSHSFASQVESMRTAVDVFSDMKFTALDALVELVKAGVDKDLETFSSFLAPHTTQEVLADLRAWATTGEGLVADVAIAVRRWNDTYRELLRRKSELQQRESELRARVEASPAEDDDLQKQHATTRSSLWFTTKQLKKHSDEYWIAALERVGLLPNFTLLDETVEFHLSVTSYNDVIEEFETSALQYSRGVSSALVELAPGNTFYVQGVAATIDTVDLGTEQSAIVQWRLCPTCSYSEPVGEDSTAGPCPSCGAPAFADRDQVIDVVEMNKVSATVDSTYSAINDFHDERRSVRFRTQLSFDIPDNGYGAEWYLQGTGFGMQYLSHVNMRWLNLGRFGGGGKKMFASTEMEAPMFRVCEHCGHLDSEAGTNHWSDHHPWCKYRSTVEEHSITFALGRTLGTQGVLVHLPALLSVMESTTLPSLLAALKMGFKMHLGGNPDHLEIEPVRVSSEGNVIDMLLIHDRIPGGTGYLAQFTDPKEVRTMCEVAYTHLIHCSCANEERQACPSCLLPYVPEHMIPSLSRGAAATALGKILANDMHLAPDEDPRAGSWEGMVVDKQPERSEASKLEQRFIEQLRQDLKAVGATITDSIVDNYAHWTIRFPGSPHIWRLREQVTIGLTRPDIFLETDDPDIRKIAIYLDGEAFHAVGRNQGVADDFGKRNDLYAQGILPWSMTWQDIDKRQRAAAGQGAEPPVWHNSQVEAQLAAMLNLSKMTLQLLQRDPMSQLLEILRDPTCDWAKLSQAAFFTAVMGGHAENGVFSKRYLRDVDVQFNGMSPALELAIPEGLVDVEAWRVFLNLSNLAYLAPAGARVTVVEQGGVDKPKPAPTVVLDPEPTPTPEPVADPAWAELIDEFGDEEDIGSALHALVEAGVPAPDPDTIGHEVAGIPLVAMWPGQKVMLTGPGDEEEVSSQNAATGYVVVAADFDPDTIPPQLCVALGIDGKEK